MGNLTKNLSRYEFACQCGCGFDTVDYCLVNILQDICDHFHTLYDDKITIQITSGNRCKRHNDELRELYIRTNGKQGANTAVKSQHIYGRAADFKLFRNGVQIPEEVVYPIIDQFGNKVSIGRYSNRNHVDTRTDGGKRWDVRPVR